LKLKKDELDAITGNGVGMAILGIISLAGTACPVPELYAICEDHAEHCNQMRVELGLEVLPVPDVIQAKMVSKQVAKIVAMKKEAALKENKVKEKSKIGFQMPDAGSEQVEVEAASNEVEVDTESISPRRLGLDATAVPFLRPEDDPSKMN